MVPSIQIHNVGPVKEFEFNLDPGVTILFGPNGAGKTTILRTVQLASGTAVDRKPMKSDGVKAGEAVVGGRTLTISKTTRSEGDLTVEGLGELSDGTRTQIDAMARERGCYILTAQADDGKLRAETWAARAEAVAA